jgi:hypothetical protein
MSELQKLLINDLIMIKKLEHQNAMQETLLLISECVDFLIHNYLTQAKIPVNATTVDKLLNKCLFRCEYRKIMFASNVTENSIKDHLLDARPARTDESTLVQIDYDTVKKLFNLVTDLYFHPLNVYYDFMNVQAILERSHNCVCRSRIHSRN